MSPADCSIDRPFSFWEYDEAFRVSQISLGEYSTAVIGDSNTLDELHHRTKESMFEQSILGQEHRPDTVFKPCNASQHEPIHVTRMVGNQDSSIMKELVQSVTPVNLSSKHAKKRICTDSQNIG
jgi:hypothetical protein